MIRFRLCVACMVIAAIPAFAQQQPGLPLPRLDAITPPGAKAGTTIAELALVGADLEDTEALLFNHPGLKAEIIVPPAPPPAKVDPKAPKKEPPPMPKGPQPASKFKITVAADVPPGNYDVRVVNKFGVSNPRVFVVGDLIEVMEKEPNNDVPEAMKLDLNTTVNGTIAAPTDVDLYSISPKKGQRIVLAVIAESIDSRAQPLLEVYDVSGRRLVGTSGPDAVTDFVVPADGEYYIRVAEFTYNVGGPNNFYRLTASTKPWIDAVYPPMVEPGKSAQVTVYGRNLPGGTPEPGAFLNGRPLEKLVVTITAPAESTKLTYRGRVEPRSGGTDGFEYRLKGPGGVSNPILIGFAQDKAVLEKEPNDKADLAMEIPAPCEIAGRIDKRGDRDFYAINAKKGESYVIDLWADRMGVPTDFLFSVRAPKATTDMTEKDDNPEVMNNTQFYARTTDPDAFSFTAAEDGRYTIQVISRESGYQYGPRSTYRLRVGPARPDFRVVAMPASNYAPDVTVLRADGNNYLELYAFRNDGFTGPISIVAEGLPAGVTALPQVIGSGQRSGSLVLSAAAGAKAFSGPITLKATATIAGKPVARDVRYATISWSVQPMQNIPTITRLDQNLMLAVRDQAYFKVTAEPENAFLVKAGEKLPQPLTLKQGEKVTVPFKVARIHADAKVALTMRQISTAQNPQAMPVTVSNGAALPALAPDKADGTFVIDVKSTAPPGLYSIVLTATGQLQLERAGAKGKRPTTVEQAVTPITIQVVPLALAKVSGTPTGKFVGGTNGELVVKVERQFDFAGEFKAKLVLPPNTKGVTVDDITIPAGQSEAKFVVKLAPDVVAGQIQPTVQVTGMFDGKLAIVQESPKLTLNIEKAPAPKKEEPKKK